MNTQSFKTYSAKPKDIERQWYVIDARGEVVGRLATRIATVLRGKHKPAYTPHIDTGDFVIVTHADEVRFTGQKETQKVYHRYSGYPGGGKTEAPESLRTRRPEEILRRAVKGMLPKGALGRQMYTKLKVYTGPDHPHDAQQPRPLDEAVR
jgi:large subunit ribosomal protein L13